MLEFKQNSYLSLHGNGMRLVPFRMSRCLRAEQSAYWTAFQQLLKHFNSTLQVYGELVHHSGSEGFPHNQTGQGKRHN